MFIQPMWSNEVERIGLQRCTPLGYRLRAFGELFGALGLLALFVVAGWLMKRASAGTFDGALWWWCAVPVVCVVLEYSFVAAGWSLARRRGFEYDEERRLSSWIENGERRMLTISDLHEQRERTNE